MYSPELIPQEWLVLLEIVFVCVCVCVLMVLFIFVNRVTRSSLFLSQPAHPVWPVTVHTPHHWEGPCFKDHVKQAAGV